MEKGKGRMAMQTGRRRWLKRTLIGFAVLILLMAVGFFIYVGDYYRADAATVAAIAPDETIRQNGRLTVISPPAAGAASGTGGQAGLNGTGLVFYPGGKVAAQAYVPLLKRIARGGVTCVLVSMPFNLAVFDINAAERAFAAVPDVKSWYIGGHSLGGVMASSYLSSHPDKARGLVLLGAYIYGNVPASRALTVYGSEDRVLDRGAINYTENVVEIKGGNHAQFGNYGPQRGDGTATVDRDAQQGMTADAVLAFMRRLG